MKLEEALSALESAKSKEELVQTMGKITGNYGFAALNFLDISRPDVHVPFYAGTHEPQFENAYRDNYFIYADSLVATARRTSVPFTWTDEKISIVDIRKTKKARELMELALDHGFTQGLVVPFHMFDQFGLAKSALCSYFWSSKVSSFEGMLQEKKHDLHIITTYFGQHLSDLAKEEWQQKIRLRNAANQPLQNVHLTDRERDALSWAARGKTADETADILGISRLTVIQHIQNAKRKLGATNITQAAATALYLGVIDY